MSPGRFLSGTGSFEIAFELVGFGHRCGTGPASKSGGSRADMDAAADGALAADGTG